ncbi:MAG: leucine-rich repeat protein [Clostridia bacterium]|nr:leucine-rich repeat protein [Clostridia bacterium]
MNRNSKSIRLISALLALLLLNAVIPFAAMKASANPDVNLVETGRCGSDCTWWFYDDGSFEVAGWGEMDEADSYLPEWNQNYKTDITKVVIGDEITLVAQNAFVNCSNVKSVKIGKSVKQIGASAFKNCSALKKENIDIPDSPILIGENAFKGTAFYNSESNWTNGLLYLGNHLLCAKEDITGTQTIKSGTLDIAIGTFYGCSGMTKAVLPQSLKIIGGSAFYKCSKLESVNIPYGVTELRESVFEYCSSLKSIDIPASVSFIGRFAFSDCVSLASLTIPASVKTIEWDAFVVCLALNKVTVYSSNVEIGKDAFGYFGNRTKNENFVMRCYKNSTASEYAKNNGLKTEFIERNYIIDFKPGNTIDDYKKRFPRYNAEFKDIKGELIVSGPLFTGLKVKILDTVGENEYEFVINGDVDGNGKIDSTDYITVKRHILKISDLFGAYEAAADTDGNGRIDSTDYIAIKRHILGIASL